MTRDEFVHKMRRQADAVYLACEADVAKDIADTLKLAADLLALPKAEEYDTVPRSRYNVACEQYTEARERIERLVAALNIAERFIGDNKEFYEAVERLKPQKEQP